MKRIAFITTNKSAFGGSEYLWMQTAVRCAVSGMDVTAGVPRWKNLPSELDQLRANGIALNFTTDVSKAKKLINRMLPSRMQMSYGSDGYRFLTDFKPDLTVINQGGNWGGIDVMEFCAQNGLKYVTISQAANEAKWPDDISSLKLASGLRKAAMNYYVCNANILLTELQSASKITHAKVVYNPFNVKHDYSPDYPDASGGLRMANVARHEIYPKGHDILFTVLSDRKWKERDLTVSLYGKGEQSGSVKRLKEHFGLSNVRIEGHISPEEIWRTNHALILPSRYEGLPLALVEAMLCKRVSVVTAVSGNTEVIRDNVNGFLARATTPEFLDEAMERAWSRRSDWKEMGIVAGDDIRKTVPADPVGHMCNELMSISD